MRLTKVNETHKNMVTTKYPTVTDFGPPRRRPGRKAARSEPARVVYVGPSYGRRPSRKPASYYKPNVIKAKRARS